MTATVAMLVRRIGIIGLKHRRHITLKHIDIGVFTEKRMVARLTEPGECIKRMIFLALDLGNQPDGFRRDASARAAHRAAA